MGIKYFGTNSGGEIKNKCEECNKRPLYFYVETRFGERYSTKLIDKILFWRKRYIDNTIKFYCKKHFPFSRLLK